MNRLKHLECSLDFFMDFLKNGVEGKIVVIENKLPDDTELVGIGMNESNGNILLILKSESFPEVPNFGDKLHRDRDKIESPVYNKIQ